ncbi:hypothetical protein UC78_0469 [Campylobacter jejuni subsp. jejuni]|nr:hypothetical protein UC78_0469 [Campylobacter jejuni subsp. jejuni]
MKLLSNTQKAIASASCDISTGEWMHIHNTAGIRGRGDKE